MKTNIKATGIELTPAISDYVEKKLALVEEKYFANGNSDIVAQVEIGKVTQHHRQGEVFKAEVHITGNGFNYYAVETMEDLYAAIDKVKDEISQEIRRDKDKRSTLAKRGGQVAKNVMKGFTWGVERVRGIKFRKKKDGQ